MSSIAHKAVSVSPRHSISTPQSDDQSSTDSHLYLEQPATPSASSPVSSRFRPSQEGARAASSLELFAASAARGPLPSAPSAADVEENANGRAVSNNPPNQVSPLSHKDLGAKAREAGVRALTLSDAVTKSTISGTPEDQEAKILLEFNKGNVKTYVTESTLLGDLIGRDEFRIVHRKNVPQLLGYTPNRIRLKMYPSGGAAEDVGTFKKTKLCFGAHGRHVVNVKPGKYVKAWLGNQPVLLGQGAHVIRHNNFRLDDSPEVDQSEPYIKHGTLSIVRVPHGKIAKIWLGQTPHFLEAADDAYVFDSPLFLLEKFRSRGDQKDEIFNDASAPRIEHGPLKRLLPTTGTVAVTFNAGKLEIIQPSNDGKPILINSASHTVERFLPVNTQTLIFPSEKTKEERKKEGVKDLNYINYDVFRTSDSCDIGVKLLVVYHIEDPLLTLTKLGDIENINSHIENLVVADMGSVIQQCSSQNFMSTDQTRIDGRKIDAGSSSSAQSAEPGEKVFNRYLQDTLKNKLQEDFAKYGIFLERLNVETPIILKLSEQSKKSTETSIKVANLAQQNQIAVSEATMRANEAAIQQDQENKTRLQLAEADISIKTAVIRAEVERAKMQAEIEKLHADAKYYSVIKAAEAEKERLMMLGQVWKDNPALFQLEMARIQAGALTGLKTAMISPEDAVRIYRLGGQSAFFQGKGEAAADVIDSPSAPDQQLAAGSQSSLNS